MMFLITLLRLVDFQMNRAIFRDVLLFRGNVDLFINKSLGGLLRSWLSFLCRRRLLSFRCWGSLLLLLFILFLLELHRHFLRRLFKFLFLLFRIIIKFSFRILNRFSTTLTFLSFITLRRLWLLLLNFRLFFFGSGFRLFLWRFRFLLLLRLGLLFGLFLSLIFRLSILIARDKLASEPYKEIINIEPLCTLLGLCKHLVRWIRHLRSKICCIVVNCTTLGEMSARVHIHLIIEGMLRKLLLILLVNESRSLLHSIQTNRMNHAYQC